MLETTNNRVSLLSALSPDSSTDTSSNKEVNLNEDKDSNIDVLDLQDPTAIFNEFLQYLNTNDNTSKDNTTHNLDFLSIKNLNSTTDTNTTTNPESLLDTNTVNTSDNIKDLQHLAESMLPSFKNMNDSIKAQLNTNTTYNSIKNNEDNSDNNNNFVSNEVLNSSTTTTENIDTLNSINNINTTQQPATDSDVLNSSFTNTLDQYTNTVALNQDTNTTYNDITQQPASTLTSTISTNSFTNTLDQSNTSNTTATDTTTSIDESQYLNTSLNKFNSYNTISSQTEDSNNQNLFSKLDLRTAPTLSVRSVNDIKEKTKQNYNTVNDIVYNDAVNKLSQQNNLLKMASLTQPTQTTNEQVEDYSNLMGLSQDPTTLSSNTNVTNTKQTKNTQDFLNTSSYTTDDLGIGTNNLVDNTKNIHTSSKSRSYYNLDSRLWNNNSSSNNYNGMNTSLDGNEYNLDSTKSKDSTSNQYNSLSFLDNLSSVKREDSNLKVSSMKENVSNIAINKIVQQSRLLIDAGGSRADIDLSSYGLGKLSISINKTNKNLSLKIETDSNQVKQLLSDNIATLKENLSQQNIEFRYIDIQNHSEKNWNFISSDLNFSSDSNNNSSSNNNSNNDNNSNSSFSGYNNSQSGSNLSYNEGNSFFDSSDKFTDSGYESSTSSSSTEEKVSDSSYSKRKIQHNGKIQVLI